MSKKYYKSIQCKLTHIKRDGGLICKKDNGEYKFFYVKVNTISFKDAHNIDFTKDTRFCEHCVNGYYEILNNLKTPIVI